MSFHLSCLRPKYAIRHTRPTEPIRFPQDDAAHYWAQSEWWYYTGRLVDRDQRIFGFELTFFKRITSEDSAPFLLVPAHWLRDVGLVSHFAITDSTEKRFAYKTIHNLFRDWRADPRDYHVSINGWSARKDNGTHLLSAHMKDYRIDLRLLPTKEPVLHEGNGIVQKVGGNTNYYYSYTHMDVEGTLELEGKVNSVKGKAWMDHEYGTICVGKHQKGWDWFGIQFDDDSELMVTRLRDAQDEAVKSFGTLVDREGNKLLLCDNDLEIRPKTFWYSKNTHAHYPAAWEIRVIPLDLVLDIRPLLADQELVTRPIPYWEGIASVTGRFGTRPITGYGYAELVGYTNKTSFKKYSQWISGRDDTYAAEKAATRDRGEEPATIPY